MNLVHRPNPPAAVPFRPLALGGALLWGVFEFIALWRSRGPRRPG